MLRVTLKEYQSRIEGLLEENRLPEAAAHCHFILQQYPRHIHTYRLFGRALLEQQLFEDSIDIFRRVINADPEDLIAHAGIALAYRENDQISSALWHMRRAFELEPYNEALRAELSDLIERASGRGTNSIYLSKAALARLYFRGRLYSRAVAEILPLLKVYPKRWDLQILLAEIYYWDDRRLDADELCADLLQELPYCIKANAIMVDMRLRGGRYDEAKKYLSKLQSLTLMTASDIDPDTTVGKVVKSHPDISIPEQIYVDTLEERKPIESSTISYQKWDKSGDTKDVTRVDSGQAGEATRFESEKTQIAQADLYQDANETEWPVKSATLFSEEEVAPEDDDEGLQLAEQADLPSSELVDDPITNLGSGQDWEQSFQFEEYQEGVVPLDELEEPDTAADSDLKSLEPPKFIAESTQRSSIEDEIRFEADDEETSNPDSVEKLEFDELAEEEFEKELKRLSNTRIGLEFDDDEQLESADKITVDFEPLAKLEAEFGDKDSDSSPDFGEELASWAELAADEDQLDSDSYSRTDAADWLDQIAPEREEVNELPDWIYESVGFDDETSLQSGYELPDWLKDTPRDDVESSKSIPLDISEDKSEIEKDDNENAISEQNIQHPPIDTTRDEKSSELKDAASESDSESADWLLDTSTLGDADTLHLSSDDDQDIFGSISWLEEMDDDNDD